ncbi:inositol monophosphatase family protein [Bacillus tianshenii]|nr:inositol monophosphatase family protein [Bacillus tianshenii]
MANDWQKIYKQTKEWVREAGTRIRASFSETLMVDYKLNPSDLVTNMDKQTEQYFIAKIKEHYPEHRILGEEGYGDIVDTVDGTVWIIDPIDGTMNFVHMQRHFAISVGIYHNGEGIIGMIYDVVNDELYHTKKGEGAYKNDEQLPMLGEISVDKAVVSVNAGWVIPNSRIEPHILPPLVKALRGTRSMGSAAIEMAYVASGKIDGYITLQLAPWDYAAGKILIEEVGGRATNVAGKPLNVLEKSTVFVGKPGLHEQIVKDYLLK